MYFFFLHRKLNDLEQRAEELDRKRTEKSSISSVSFINNRNRKNNVLKAEMAIQEEMKRKEVEGVEDNPFTRRKCNPRMVTKNAANADVTPEMLRQLAEKENDDRAAAAAAAAGESKGGSNGAAAAGDKRGPADGGKKPSVPAGKRPKLDGSGKEDLFDAHDFDIEIDVDMSSASSASAPVKAAPAAGSAAGGGGSALSGASAAAGGGKSGGPAKRSLNLSDYKKKRGLI